MEITVISSCTGMKAVETKDDLTLADFRDPSRLTAREAELKSLMKPAAIMYTGEQHVKLMNGVSRLRRMYGAKVVNVWIVSAGYGLIPEDRIIAPYNATFRGMSKPEIHSWARHLHLPERVRSVVRDRSLVFFLLGNDYLEALQPPLEPSARQRFVFFASRSAFKSLRRPGVTLVPAGTPESSQYGAGNTALKGRMFELLAAALAKEGASLYDAIRADDTPRSVEEAIRRGQSYE